MQVVSFVGAVIISGCVLYAAPAAGASANAQAAPAATTAPAASPSAPTALPRGRVYLFRGALGLIFSRGMDKLAKRIEEAGVSVDVNEFTICAYVAERAIREYRQNPAPITLIGHSMGGFCALQFAEKLQAENIPIGLIVTIDPAHLMPKLPMNVERYMNIFLARDVLGGGDVVPEKGYQGHFASFDLSKLKGVLHINIEKMDIIHTQLLTKILQIPETPARLEGEGPCPSVMLSRPMPRSICGTAVCRPLCRRATRWRRLRSNTACLSGRSRRSMRFRRAPHWWRTSALSSRVTWFPWPRSPSSHRPSDR